VSASADWVEKSINVRTTISTVTPLLRLVVHELITHLPSQVKGALEMMCFGPDVVEVLPLVWTCAPRR
jgi:hypothetical protein